MTGLSLRSLREHAVHFAHQEAEHVDRVDSRLMDEEPRHLLKIGLAVEIRMRPLAIAGAHAEGDVVRRADGADAEKTGDLAVPRLEAPVLVRHQQRACALGCLDEAPGLVQRRRQGLLADHGNAALRRDLDEAGMAFRRGDDVHQVGFGAVKHLSGSVNTAAAP
jgi:hypothetical protein